ncbi:hypothetical protein AsFcp4_144 [Aeromonas phage AsFcp_4]|nr:hypothetical protein AsFcp4_144 [Aeromonas phage AsFcp_4]
MADLKLGTQIGGNLVWHQGILELNPVDDKLNYRDQEIMTTRGYQTLLGTTNFNVGGSKYDLVSMPTQAKNTKSFLRKFRSGDTDAIWHETVQGSVYRISTGNTDSDLVMQLSGTGAIFEEAVLTNAAQSSASNSFTRKDFVNAEDAKKVNKSGDGMTGNLDFNLDNQGIRVKFSGGSVANNCGVFGGKGDAALKDKTNININSWYGVGFSPTVGVGKAVADGENSIWFNLRSGNMYTVGRLFVDGDKEVYSSVNKPTPGDLNAYTKAEVNDKQFIRVKDERVTMSGPSGQGNREFSSFFTNKTDVSTGWVSGFTIKGWDGTYASWSLFAGSRSDVDQNQLWFRHGRSTWLPSSRIYHEQDKPTNVELNLVSRDGDTMTGTLNINVTDAYKLGTPHSINLNNGSLGGINMLAFNDPSDVDNEGILFPKTGKNGNSNVQADYDILRALDGKLLFNSRETYGEWNKPTADDVQAIADVRTVLSVDLDSVVIPGSYFQSANVNATPKKHYPVELAGTLFVIRSANGVQQEYTTFTGRKFTRGRSSTGWLEWKEFYGEAYPVQFVDKKGDTMTGTLKVPNIVIESTYDNMLTLNCTDDGPNYIAFQRSGDNRFFIRQATTGNIATDRLDFLSGVKTDGGAYIAPLWIDSNGVYTNVPQKDASNALTRKDYVDQKVGTAVQSVTATGAVKSTGGINPVISLINATNKIDGAMSAADKAKLDGLPSAAVNKVGDSMTGNLTFTNDSQLIWSRNTDWAKIGFKNDSDADADSYMWFETGDNGIEYFKFRMHNTTGPKHEVLNIKLEGSTFAHDVILKARESNAVKLTNATTEYTGNTGGERIIGGITSQWYDDNLVFGHIRSGSKPSAGFGVRLNDKYIMRVTPDRRLATGALVGDSYVAVAKNDRILAMEVDTTTKVPYISVDATYQAIRFENDRAITMPAGALNVASNISSGGDVFAKTNVNVTGQEISFADGGKTAGETGITTARFLQLLSAMGAFKTVHWCGKVTWNYAGNNVLTDTGYGNIHLAGCVVEVIGTSQYIIRIITPTTTGTKLPNAQDNASCEFIYVNHGPTHSPGWRRQVNTNDVNFKLSSAWNEIVGKIPYIGNNGVMEIGKYIDFHDTNSTEDFTTRLMVGGSKQLQIVSTNGSIDIGAQNTGYAHIYTDRPSFYMNKELQINGARVMYEGSTHGTLTLSNWIRTTGNSGWFNATYSGGIHMTDTTWLRAYNGKKFYVANTEGDALSTSGGVYAAGNGNFNDVQVRSDERLKSNFEPILNALDKVDSLSGCIYDKVGKTTREAGIIAQRLKAVLPEATGTAKDSMNPNAIEYLTVSNSGVNALLVEAIKELRAELNELKSKLNIN